MDQGGHVDSGHPGSDGSHLGINGWLDVIVVDGHTQQEFNRLGHALEEFSGLGRTLQGFNGLGHALEEFSRLGQTLQWFSGLGHTLQGFS